MAEIILGSIIIFLSGIGVTIFGLTRPPHIHSSSNDGKYLSLIGIGIMIISLIIAISVVI